MPYLSCKKIENDVYNFPTWQYCKYKDIFDSRIIINSTAKFYISISYQKDLLSIDTRIFTPSRKIQCPTLISVYHSVCSPKIHRVLQVLWSQSWLLYFCSSCWAVSSVNYRLHRLCFYWYSFLWEDFLNPCILSFLFTSSFNQIINIAVLKNKLFCSTLVL